MATLSVERQGERVVVTVGAEDAYEVRLHLLAWHIPAAAVDDRAGGVARFVVMGHNADDVDLALAEWELSRW